MANSCFADDDLADLLRFATWIVRGGTVVRAIARGWEDAVWRADRAGRDYPVSHGSLRSDRDSHVFRGWFLGLPRAPIFIALADGMVFAREPPPADESFQWNAGDF